MPYIAQEDRDGFEEFRDLCADLEPKTAGEIQYMIAVIVAEFMKNSDYRYQNMNDVMGALNGANLEFYRRYVAPYEDECIAKNGDVFFNRNQDNRGY
ncbi:hypothetical protein N9165_00305 [Akkermansiaceae bacterium]|nr:hypothetical protein [Akkermansiaceae bacterium]